MTTFLNLTLATDKYEFVGVPTAAEIDGNERDPETGDVIDMDDEPVSSEQVEITHPVRLDPTLIAYFHPRLKGRFGRDRVGTRIVLKNGNALAVRELFDEVVRMLGGTGFAPAAG